MTKIATILFCIFLLIVSIQTGRIRNGDLWVDYANAGSMTELSFAFMLQSPIDQYDYIKVSLPFPLHSQLTPAVPATQGLSSPLFLVVTYDKMDQFTVLSGTPKYGQVLTQTIDSSNYFIRFYDSDRKTLLPISNNQWYYLKFKTQSSEPLQYQKSNSILQIQIATVSSVWSNAIVYDDNLAFNYFQLASTPPKTITLISTPYNFGSSGGYLLTQASYDMYLDVTMNIDTSHYADNLVLRFLISQEDSFTFTNACSSVAKNNAPTISMLDPTLYTCTVDTDNNIMQVLLKPAAMMTQTSYRFTVKVTNPSIVVKDVSVIVRAIKQTSKVIIAYGEAAKALNTNQIYITYQQIFIGWGLRPDALLPFDARVFRGNAATPTYMPYNSLSTKFSVSQTTSSNVQLKIIIDIPSELNAFVLQNGFTSNLPAFTDKIVRCATQNAISTTLRRIGCTGIGSLVAGTVYYIGWKMFFPYDNYESSIDCTQFGTLTVYTVKKITKKDVAFVLGRSNQFLKYLKGTPDYFVIGRNSTYITYMKTFLNLNLVVLSNDFQEFLKQPQSVYVTNRPKTFTDKTFNDVYVISQNLAFLTYISLFTDIYVAARLPKDTDIAKGLDTYPLIAKTTPKNTLTLKTSNSKDWSDFSTFQYPLVSSSATLGTTTSTSGLHTALATPQSLIFSLKAPYSEVTSFSSAAPVLTNNWGFLIMMNSKISASGGALLTQTTASPLLVKSETVNSASAYNSYTLITIRGSLPSSVQTLFPTTASKVNFGVQPFVTNTFSSIYSDSNNMDVMIATIDGIDGPLNKIKYNGFFLINAFTMVDIPLGTLQMQFINYNSASPLDGSKVPTFLRLKGSISAANVDSLTVFFDKLTPFYSNYYSGEIYCYSTDGAKFCNFHRGAEAIAEKYNYNSLSRFQIHLQNPSNPFNILIPITFAVGQTLTNFYVGYQTKVAGVKALAYIQILRPISLTGTGPSANGEYGPEVGLSTVGAMVNNLLLHAKRTTTLVQNTGNNIGSAFSYFSEWDYFGSAVVTGWTQGVCQKISYVYYYTNYDAYLTGVTFVSSYKFMTGIVCFADTANAAVSSRILTIATSTLPAKWGKKIPGYGAYSLQGGLLDDLKINYVDIGNPQTATTIIPPIAGASLVKAVGKWVFTLPVNLNGNVKITILGDGQNIPFTASTPGTCAVYLGERKSTVGCNFAAVPTQLEYVLSINEQGLLTQGSDMTIVHYGFQSSSVALSNVKVNITCYSLLNTNAPTTADIIWLKNGIIILWQPTGVYLGPSSFSLNSFVKSNLNKAAISDFSFSFTLISKGLYVTNRVRIDLGQLAVDNINSAVTQRCVVLNYSPDPLAAEIYSHDWGSVDISQGLSKLELWPQKNLLSSNLTYTVKCYNFITTSSPNPISMAGKIVNTSVDLTGDLLPSTGITPMQLTYNDSKSSQVSLTKKYTIPSTLIEMTFSILSPGIAIDSIMYLGFPSYYSNGLGPDIKCYTNSQIYCSVINRYLTIKYLGTYGQGQTFSLVVAGITQPITYNSGTFFYLIDTDSNPIQVQSSGTFIDAVSSTVLTIQNFPVFPIYSMLQSSAYLRQEAVSIVMQFFLSTSLPFISVGQSLYMVFPPIYADVLRFMSLTCTLNIKNNTLKNYINSCTVLGFRLKMPFLDDVVLGTTYTLNIAGIVNPTNPSADVYKYSLQISDNTGSSIIAKSYSPQGNFVMPIFVMNPNRLSLNYYTVADGLVSSVYTMANLQSKQVYISPGSNLGTSVYQRNVYLQVLNTLYSVPAKIDLPSGSNPFPIRMSSLTVGVNYVYFSKSGDGNFYSSLPPLTLISNKNYFTPLSFVETSFNLPIGAAGLNYSIVVNLPLNLYPMSEVSMTVTLDSIVGLSLRDNPTVIKFYPQKTSATIVLKINDANLWISGATTNMIVTPNNTDTYAGPATIVLNAIASSSNIPRLTLTAGVIGLKDYTFSVTCSQFGKFIYHISRKFSYNASACTLSPQLMKYWIQQSSITGLRVTQTFYQCEDVLGAINIVASGTPQILAISNLQASFAYTIRGYCQTQNGLSSNVSSIDFYTKNNGGVVSKIDFYFVSPLTTAQKIKLSCSLALIFKVDYLKVSTWDGYYCSQLLSRRLLMQNQVSQNKFSRQLQVTTYRTDVYFGVNNALNTDNTRAPILAQSTATNLLNQLNANVVGLPLLVSYNANKVAYAGTIQIQGTPFVDAGPAYAYIKGLSMNKDGLIYVLVGDSAIWNRDPTVSEIKQGSGPNGLPPLFYKVLAYRVADQAKNMAWTDMPSGVLKMYVLPSDDNPFDTANFGTIQVFTIKRQAPLWENKLQFFITLLLVIVGLVLL